MMRHHFKHRVAVISALAASVLGSSAPAAAAAGDAQGSAQLSQQQSFSQQQQQQASPQQPRQQPAERQVTDGAIAGVISASHRFEIALATIARRQARSQEVKDFAREMLDSHTRSERRLSALLRRLRIKVEPTRVSSMLTGHSSLAANYLRRQPAEKFDQVFMATQVMTHRVTLQMLDKYLIPDVKDETLKQELQAMRAEVASHLERAQAIQAKLAQGQR